MKIRKATALNSQNRTGLTPLTKSIPEKRTSFRTAGKLPFVAPKLGLVRDWPAVGIKIGNNLFVFELRKNKISLIGIQEEIDGALMAFNSYADIAKAKAELARLPEQQRKKAMAKVRTELKKRYNALPEEMKEWLRKKEQEFAQAKPTKEQIKIISGGIENAKTLFELNALWNDVKGNKAINRELRKFYFYKTRQLKGLKFAHG